MLGRKEPAAERWAGRAGPLAVAVLLAVLAPACKGREWKQSLLHSRNPVAIYLEHKDTAEGKPAPQGFAHPAEVSPEDLRFLFASLKFHSRGFFRGSQVETLFRQKELEDLPPALSAALRRAGPDERVRFLVSRTSSVPLRSGATAVSAAVFLDTPGHLNLAFDFLDESLGDENDPRAVIFRGDPVKIVGRTEDLLPPSWATLKPGSVPSEIHPRWLEVDLRTLASARAAAPPPLVTPVEPVPAAPVAAAASAPAAVSPPVSGATPNPNQAAAPPGTGAPAALSPEAEAVNRKLQVLDELKRNGKITEEAYEKARLEILLQK